MNENITEVTRDIISFFKKITPATRIISIATVLAVIAGGITPVATSLDYSDFYNFSFSYSLGNWVIIIGCAALAFFSYRTENKKERADQATLLAKIAIWASVALYIMTIYWFYTGYTAIQADINRLKTFSGLFSAFSSGNTSFGNSPLVQEFMGENGKRALDIVQGKLPLYIFPSLGTIMYFSAARLLGRFARKTRESVTKDANNIGP